MAPPDWKQYSPDPTPEGEDRPAVASYQPPEPPKRVRTLEERTVRRPQAGSPALIGVAGVVLVAGVSAGVFALAGGSDDVPTGVDVPAAAEPEKPDVQSAAGFADLLAALKKETGSTTVFEAVLYPEYASVDAPYRPGDERELSYHWDGELRETGKGNTDDAPFDLAKLDGSLFEGMCAKARALVEDPESCYLIISRPSSEDAASGWISAYANNEFQQGGYIEFALNGAEVERHTW